MTKTSHKTRCLNILFNTLTPYDLIMRRFLSTSSLPPTIRQLLSARVQKQGGPPVQVNGWVKSVRLQKNIAFAVISDGTSDRGLQAVFKDVDLAKRYIRGTVYRRFSEACINADPNRIGWPMALACGCVVDSPTAQVEGRTRSYR